MKKNSIYGYVRCETKNCANSLGLLRVAKVLIGKQKCQICKNTMQQIIVKKNLEEVKNKKSKNRKINHFFKNLDIEKLLNVLNNWEPELVYDLAEK